MEIPQAIRNHCKHVKVAKNDIYITMVDYSDAYGSVLHQRLLEIITAIGLPRNSVNLIKQLIMGHGLHVKTHFGLTKRIELHKGIAQGDHIAPTFFNLYTELLTVIPFNEPVKIVGYTFTANNAIGCAGRELINKVIQLIGELNLSYLKPHHAIAVVNAIISGNVILWGN